MHLNRVCRSLRLRKRVQHIFLRYAYSQMGNGSSQTTGGKSSGLLAFESSGLLAFDIALSALSGSVQKEGELLHNNQLCKHSTSQFLRSQRFPSQQQQQQLPQMPQQEQCIRPSISFEQLHNLQQKHSRRSDSHLIEPPGSSFDLHVHMPRQHSCSSLEVLSQATHGTHEDSNLCANNPISTRDSAQDVSASCVVTIIPDRQPGRASNADEISNQGAQSVCPSSAPQLIHDGSPQSPYSIYYPRTSPSNVVDRLTPVYNSNHSMERGPSATAPCLALEGADISPSHAALASYGAEGLTIGQKFSAIMPHTRMVGPGQRRLLGEKLSEMMSVGSANLVLCHLIVQASPFNPSLSLVLQRPISFTSFCQALACKLNGPLLSLSAVLRGLRVRIGMSTGIFNEEKVCKNRSNGGS